ncbi:MAG: LacI family DNA-binding transcriptional regulator [Capsulimonadales bacterium]|nr:LacI family DNA-binding transcriptional regulator [Capsulimonadales bacterium]
MRRSRVTASDVAKKAGVSPTTVSVVFSNRESNGIPEETRKRVRDAATILGYRPHGLARALARGRTDVIGIVLFQEAPVTDPDSYFLRSILNLLLLDVLRVKRNPLLFASLSYDPIDPYVLADGRADAFILISPEKDEPILGFLEAQGLPFVAIGARAEFRHGVTIDGDNENGVASAIEHLVSCGHTRIAHLAGPVGNWDGDIRREAFVREMQRRGLTVPSHHIVNGAFIMQEAEEAALSLLTRPDRPTALFAGNDNMAIGAYRAAERLELRIPEDLSVVGFDDIEHARVLSPPLTTVRQPIAEMAEAAVRLLVQPALPGQPESRSLVFPTTLTERGSVASPQRQGGNVHVPIP